MCQSKKYKFAELGISPRFQKRKEKRVKHFQKQPVYKRGEQNRGKETEAFFHTASLSLSFKILTIFLLQIQYFLAERLKNFA